MPASARVTLCYGPYESNGAVGHRAFRLQGLQAALRARGHQCVLEETRERNVVELVVSGEVVFSCHIKQLQFECVPSRWRWTAGPCVQGGCCCCGERSLRRQTGTCHSAFT
ncbi:UPF0728 protein C10orf53 homolog isoform X1 [Acanthopagrus latus]|uniref:UPF0728 protein C10orf53 homolog isoform X1 n=1 Tax=Acanthopagrus latus TaxID=8177 RepID=UPI00187C2116|nr:UPF0728 protein C10orf53 homolog isoform X1 [Acanthopagrus latus]